MGNQNIIIGNPGPVFKGARLRKTPSDGWSTVYSYTGAPDYLAPLIVAADLADDDSTLEVNTTGAKHTLDISYPRDARSGATEAPQLTYELLGNKNQRSVWEHPIARMLSHQTFIEAEEQLERKVAPDKAVFTNEPTAEGQASAKYIYRLLFLKQDFFWDGDYVLRFSATVSRKSGIRVAFSNIFKVYSETQLKTEIGNPEGLFWGVEAVMVNAPAPDYLTKVGGIYGWMKETPSIVRVANGKYQVSIEYALNTWNTPLYATPVL